MKSPARICSRNMVGKPTPKDKDRRDKAAKEKILRREDEAQGRLLRQSLESLQDFLVPPFRDGQPPDTMSDLVVSEPQAPQTYTSAQADIDEFTEINIWEPGISSWDNREADGASLPAEGMQPENVYGNAEFHMPDESEFQAFMEYIC
jgi:hypothetical protein